MPYQDNHTLSADGLALSPTLSCYAASRAAPIQKTSPLAPWQLRQASEWMQSHLHRAVSIAEVAGQLGLSPSYFARAFRAATGQPPHQWILQRRIELALQLLTEPGLPLGQIAAACGFADQSHFCRVFTSRMGMAPSRWRARCLP